MSHRGTASRPGTTLWLRQAERDRLHPAVMAYVYADPARLGDVPGAWDAVSDLLCARVPADRYLGLLGGREAWQAFRTFADRVAALPEPASVLGDGTPARVTIDDPGLAFAHVVGLVRCACGREGSERADALGRLCAYAVDHLRPDLARWVADLVEGPHDTRFDAGHPGVARCLDRIYPERARDRIDGSVAHRS